MEQQYSSTPDQRSQFQTGSLGVEYKRILFNALRFWYLVVLSAITGLLIAYLINRYTTRIFPVKASMIIRESEEIAGARLLYNNPLANPYRNFLNEPYILRSYPLIQAVIEDLNFQVVIQKQGNIKTTEQYNRLPVEIKNISAESGTGSFLLEVIDERTFRCMTEEGKGNKTYQFGDTIRCAGDSMIVIKTGTVASLIGEQLRVQYYDPSIIASSYIGRMKVDWALQGASVINLEINGAIPQKEIDFINQLISNYQAYDLEKKNQAASRSIAFIDNQLQLIGDSLAVFERQLQAFKQRNVVTEMGEETMRLYQELETLEAKKVDLLVAGNYYDYLQKYLTSGQAGEQVILPSSMGISDPVLNKLVSDFIDIQLEVRSVKPGTKPNPLVENQLKVVGRTRDNILESIQSLRSTDKIKNDYIERSIKNLERQLGGLPEAERRLVNIRRNYALSESIYIFLMQKRAEAGISKASTTSDIVIVNPPRLAGAPITPRISQNYLVFGGFGLLLPFVIFYLIEFFNQKVQSKEDIEKLTSVPFIGGIGHKKTESNLVVFEKPKSSLAESFRALRSNLNYFTEGKDNKIFLVTSSLSGEGKTFTTINLATVFALSGKRVLIIGADMRRPKIFDDFKLTNEIGLSSYLSGLKTLPEIIQDTEIETLKLISGGPVPPNPSELILSPKMDSLIFALQKEFDFIIIDTPPIALVTDGFVLTKYADHTIFLIRQNYTPKALLRTIDEFYQSGKFKGISLVFNDIKYTGPGYGYGGYSYGYGYGYGYSYNYRYSGEGYYDDEVTKGGLVKRIKNLFK